MRAMALAVVMVVSSVVPALAEGGSLLRTALIVGNAEASVAFYAPLGFRVEADMQMPRDPVASPFPLNTASTKTRLVILAPDSGAGGRIGLVEFTAPAARRGHPPSPQVGAGDVVLVFDVPDADAVHAALTRTGARILEPPQAFTSRTRGPKGEPLTGKVFHAWDPDGYLIELLQSPPSPAELEVRALMEEVRAANLTGDTTVLDRIYSADFVLTSQSGRRYGRTEALADSRNGFDQYDNSDYLVRPFGDTTVVHFVNTRKRREGAEVGRFAVTAVWVRLAGTWRMTSLHSSRMAP